MEKERQAESEEEEKRRFEIELEFVQTLADPGYLSYLAQTRVISQPAFVNYVKYLRYWQEPEYRKFLRFPQCLHFLDLLQNERFRTAIIQNDTRDALMKQNFLHWKYYYPTRLEEAPAAANGDGGDAVKMEIDS